MPSSANTECLLVFAKYCEPSSRSMTRRRFAKTVWVLLCVFFLNDMLQVNRVPGDKRVERRRKAYAKWKLWLACLHQVPRCALENFRIATYTNCHRVKKFIRPSRTGGCDTNVWKVDTDTSQSHLFHETILCSAFIYTPMFEEFIVFTIHSD